MKLTLAAMMALGVGLITLTGCIRQETTHSLYLTSDGRVVWAVLERDIRSDERDPAGRAREEQEFLGRFAAGLHPPVMALQHLAGLDASTRLIRRSPPYATLTEARFEAVDDLVRQILAALRMPGAVTLSRDNESVLLVVTLDYEFDWELDEDSVVCALLDATATYRIILTDGRFVSATGFSLEDDNTAAVLEEKAFEARDGERGVRLSLTWTPDSLGAR